MTDSKRYIDMLNEYISDNTEEQVFRNQFGNPSLWQLIINYINSKHNQLQIIKRKELINYINERMKGLRYSVNSIDTYRNYLYKAGYLTYMKKPNGKKVLGWYVATQEIPCDLSVDECKQEAYGPKIIFGVDRGTKSKSASAGAYYYNTKEGVVWSAKADTFNPYDPLNQRPEEFIEEGEFKV